MNKKKREPFEPLPRSMFAIAITVIVIIILIGIFFNGKSSSGNIGGQITLAMPYGGMDIILDNRNAGSSDVAGERIEFNNLQDGIHRVLVSKDGYWPWGKVVDLKIDETFDFTPFIVRIIPNMTPVPEFITTETGIEKNETYQFVQHQIDTNKKSITSLDEFVGLSYTQSSIDVEWLANKNFIPNYFCVDGDCETSMSVLPTLRNITHADFYPGSNNVILFATDNSIFAIEIDKNGTQNAQPLYQGYQPTFTIIDGIIYILDENNLSQIILD